MTAIVKQRRILLKEWFVTEDARREEAVTQVGGLEELPVPDDQTQCSDRHTPHDRRTTYPSPDPKQKETSRRATKSNIVED